jgi:hypothetical protein
VITVQLRPRATKLRYDDREFYGIMIDMGAVRRLTVGYGQYKVYERLANATLDTTIAGAACVQFGKGEAVTLIGSINIDMLLSLVEFHIIKADIPFLLSLVDLD